MVYKRNFLTDVIARVDYEIEIDALKDELFSELKEEISHLFPIIEERQRFYTNVKISADQQAINTVKTSKEWIFYSKGRGRSIVINSEFISAKCSDYQTYINFKSEFLPIVKCIFEKFDGLKGKRFGLRYINNFQIDEDKPLDFSEYLNPKLLYPIKNLPDHEYLSRFFHNAEFNFEDSKMRIQFGLFNQDFPAIIRKKSYILDFDMFYSDLFIYPDVEKKMDLFHTKIEEKFELFISDGLRGKMNE